MTDKAVKQPPVGKASQHGGAPKCELCVHTLTRVLMCGVRSAVRGAASRLRLSFEMNLLLMCRPPWPPPAEQKTSNHVQ